MLSSRLNRWVRAGNRRPSEREQLRPEHTRISCSDKGPYNSGNSVSSEEAL